MKLAPEDLKLIPSLVKMIRKSKSLSLNQIEAHYKFHGHKISIIKLRDMITYIRSTEDIIIGTDQYFLMSDHAGVWLTKDLQEINLFAKDLDKRVNQIITIKEAADNFLKRIEAQKFIDQSQKQLF